jgi:hypothetical protein
MRKLLKFEDTNFTIEVMAKIIKRCAFSGCVWESTLLGVRDGNMKQQQE